MNRKETHMRLLLTLLTCFVMVAGAFVVAVPTVTEQNAPLSDSAVVSDLDKQTRVAGDAPASAFTTETLGTSITDNIETEIGSDVPPPMVVEYSGPTSAVRDVNTGSTFAEPKSQPESGTRAASVEAYGPYGDQDNPLFEGTPVLFESDMVGANNNDFQFRWDVTGDGAWDGPGAAPSYWGAMGESDFNYQFLDNNIGEATVQAWDGTYTTTNYIGDTWTGFSMTVTLGGYYSYTYGNQFTVAAGKTIKIDKLGGYKGPYFASPYPQTPYYYYNIRLWTTGGSLLAQTGALYPADNSWAWFDIPDVTLSGGQSFIIAMHSEPYSTSTYPYYYPHIGSNSYTNLQLNDDNMLIFNGYRYYPSHDVFPTYGPYGPSYAWFCDVEYYWEETVENTVSDTTSVWVDNVAPTVLDAQAVPDTGVEGSGAGFTGSFLDPGLNDDWWYRWDWGDGTQSPWMKVNKYSGGARVLFLHCLGVAPSGYGTGTLYEDLLAMGPFITILDEWDYGPTGAGGTGNAPTLDYLLQYDVIVVGTNYFNPNNNAIGDLLADFSDIKGASGSGGVITMAFSWYGGNPGVLGRWRSENYDPLNPSSSISATSNTIGTVYDPSHPIMQGVSSISGTNYKSVITSVARGTRIANWNNGYVMVATYQNPKGSGARHAAINSLPSIYFPSGDWVKMIYNAIKWTSRMPDPVILPMPIPLETMYHTYVDDYPEHVTPADVFQAQLQVRDDDHGRTIPIGTITTLLDQKFTSSSMPPAGWFRSGPYAVDWAISNSANAGGAPYEAVFVWYNAYGANNYGRLYTGPVDTSGFTTVDISFREYLNHYSGPYTLMVETSTDGVNWDPVWQAVNPSGYNARQTSFSTTTNIGSPTTYFSWTFYGNPYNLNYWYVDNFLVQTFPAYTMSGLGSGSCDITIENVFPQIAVPGDFDNVVEEHLTIDFKGFELTDPALMEPTEEFWYRWDYGDGTAIGPWIYKGSMAKSDLNVLLLHTYSGQEASVINNLLAIMGPGVNIDSYDCGPLGSNTAPSLAYLTNYDVVVIGSNYIPAAAVGNVLDDYSRTGGGVVELVAMFHPTFGIGGDWQNQGYSVFPQSSALLSASSVTIFDPNHPIMNGAYGKVSNWGCSLAIGVNSLKSGATLLADYNGGYKAAAYRPEDNVVPGSGRIVGLNIFAQPGYFSGDANLVIANAIYWASKFYLPTPVLDTVSHDYGDNGIYTAGLQIIDDDMMWDWAPGDSQPTFTGTGDPNDWISFVFFPVEVNNVDPVISPRIRAEVNVDLVIRTTGEPKNDCTMTLWQGTTALGSVTVHHDGNYKMETLPATLDMGAINDYYVTVEYVNSDPSGANPTWIFEGRFPSGHNKELRNVFKEDGSIWTIDSSLLKNMLVGEDIIFTAVGADDGSDDLAFDWQFGDGEEGIHVYANADMSMADATSQNPADIFNANPSRDPWFDKAPNTVRSPDMNPIVVRDVISHAFDASGYYHVTLTLMDDDVGDGYPSYQYFLLGGGYDIEFIDIDLS